MPEFKKQTIVLPFDFSTPAINAWHQIREWADESNVIHMIYVVSPTPTMVDIHSPVWTAANLDLEVQEASLKKLKREYTFENVEHHCVIGDPGSEIVKLAERTAADAIVMPSHGRSGISRFFLGSVAERVLRLATCPVLILRGSKYESENSPAIGAMASSGSDGDAGS